LKQIFKGDSLEKYTKILESVDFDCREYITDMVLRDMGISDEKDILNIIGLFYAVIKMYKV
jgi:hypothetical protein